MSHTLEERLSEIQETARETNLETRLSEINEHLGPLLERLGVIAELQESVASTKVRFLPLDDDGWYSPVQINFTETPGREPTWQDAHLNVDMWGCRKLGDTGFAHWKCFHQDRQEIRGESEAKMFEWLGFVLDYHGTVPPRLGTPNCIVNEKFADLYEHIARWVPEFEIVQTYGHGDRKREPVESFKFKDKRGRDVRISMSQVWGEASLFVNGELVDELNQHNLSRFMQTVRHLCEDNLTSTGKWP